MLSKVIMKDYMVYDHAEIDLADASMIAVVGDNGSGKSAFLEALPYALYGTSRDNIANLSRLNGGGDHLVEVILGDWKVMRGRKNGKPILKVYKNADLVSKGSEANDFIIDNITGMNETAFLLTSFYGLGDTKNADNLIKVAPSVRLETLQRLKGVGIYKTLHKMAKAEHAVVLQKMEAVINKMSSIQDLVLEDVSSLISESVVLSDTVKANELELQVQRNVREQLKVQEDKYRNLLARISSLKEKIANNKQLLVEYDSDRESLLENKKTLIKEGREIEQSLKDIRKKIEAVDYDALQESLSKLKLRQGNIDLMLQLKTIATEGGVTDSCPLCGSPLEDSVTNKWTEDVIALNKNLQTTLKGITSISVEMKTYDTYTKRLVDLKNSKSNNVEGLKRIDSLISVNVQNSKKLESELNRISNTYTELLDEVGSDYQKLPSMINETLNKIEDLIAVINTDKQKIHNIKDTLSRNDAMKLKIKNYKKELVVLKNEDKAYNLLEQAWNRYGIPLNLIRELYQSIQDKASAIYQEFDNGSIVVKEVEDRGRPGVDFILHDRKGNRNFKMLSLGEKAMFFISVRVAIAQIISEIRNIHIETVILDEVLGNLSPTKRDSLIKMLNKTLRKLFPQVIMVSHTVMWDIFSKTIKLTNVNDTTQVEVI